jgi:hypothetical protein
MAVAVAARASHGGDHEHGDADDDGGHDADALPHVLRDDEGRHGHEDDPTDASMMPRMKERCEAIQSMMAMGAPMMLCMPTK